MPDNKKHHYVPKFYLRRFSENGKSIGLLNIPKGILVEKSNLKNQCYKDYFYGKDLTFEKALSQLEGEFSKLFQMIDEYESLPPPLTEEHLVLLYCLLIQEGRTKYAADALDEMHDTMMKNVFGEPIAKETGVNLDEFIIGVQDPGKYSASMHVQHYPVVLDLGYKLIRNETKKDFITSDVPVVKINPFMSFLNLGSQTGLGSKGLLVFYPISPKKLILLFDRDIYRIGSDSKHVVDVSSERDVEQMNLVQAAACYENVYFQYNNFGDKELVKRATPFRRGKKANLRVFPQLDLPNGNKSEIIMNFGEDVRFSPKISFMTIRKSAKAWRKCIHKAKSLPGAFVRNENLMNEHEQFTEELKNGNFQAHEFVKYMRDKMELKNSMKRTVNESAD